MIVAQHFGSISGGKDSQAVLCLMVERIERKGLAAFGNRAPRFLAADNGHENPITLDHIAYLDDWLRQRTGLRIEAEHLAANQALIDTLVALAAGKGVTAAQLALAWVLHQGDFIVPIPGARKVRHLEENAAAAHIILTPADLAAIEAAMPQAAISGRRYTAEALALVDG